MTSRTLPSWRSNGRENSPTVGMGKIKASAVMAVLMRQSCGCPIWVRGCPASSTTTKMRSYCGPWGNRRNASTSMPAPDLMGYTKSDCTYIVSLLRTFMDTVYAERCASAAAGSRSAAEAGGSRLQAGVRWLQRSGLLLPEETPSDRLIYWHFWPTEEDIGNPGRVLYQQWHNTVLAGLRFWSGCKKELVEPVLHHTDRSVIAVMVFCVRLPGHV